MAFTDDQLTMIRQVLGYPDVFRQYDPRLESAFVSVGNLPTEDLVCMFESMGVRTGVSPQEAVAASREIAALLGITASSHASQIGTRDEMLNQGKHNPRNPQTAARDA